MIEPFSKPMATISKEGDWVMQVIGDVNDLNSWRSVLLLDCWLVHCVEVPELHETIFSSNENFVDVCAWLDHVRGVELIAQKQLILQF